MIQVVAPSGPLQEMLLLELQGKVAIPPKLLEEAREKQQQQQQQQPVGAVKSSCNAVAGEEVAAVEVPLGRIEGDSRNEKRCSLRIGTLMVDGSRGKLREPLLVLKQRERQQSEQQQGQGQEHGVQKRPSSSRCCLLQEWLDEHPEELTLGAACAAAAEDKAGPMKVYEVVGVIERYVHLNSKPMRTLS
ncbi:hypothetical protein DQ04_10451000 [Trypanosoma grayi]|uniref:hypothetical protein n=1 Tax=Trypanosoma grayi TaxID=71804 RepID=UPI0004F40611|nr:hypothetical protein DQ04_10451000 [Trypanosoma grayi]KEG07240.1 hypothetical protein DQ04_10451000 [Trypanosoma grayi]